MKQQEELKQKLQKIKLNKTYLTRVLNNKINNIAKGFIWKKICINALTEN